MIGALEIGPPKIRTQPGHFMALDARQHAAWRIVVMAHCTAACHLRHLSMPFVGKPHRRVQACRVGQRIHLHDIGSFLSRMMNRCHLRARATPDTGVFLCWNFADVACRTFHTWYQMRTVLHPLALRRHDKDNSKHRCEGKSVV